MVVLMHECVRALKEARKGKGVMVVVMHECFLVCMFFMLIMM